MNIAKLKTEIIADPLSRDYAAMTNVEVAASLHVEDRERLIPISSADLLAWCAGTSAGDRPRYLKIEEAAAAHVSEAVQAIAKAALRMIERDGTSLDLAKPDRAAMVDGLVAGGVLSVADKTSLTALATEPISRAEELGLGAVNHGHIVHVR